MVDVYNDLASVLVIQDFMQTKNYILSSGRCEEHFMPISNKETNTLLKQLGADPQFPLLAQEMPSLHNLIWLYDP